MKSLNGLVFIIIGSLIIWIGATGRFPALAAALGMIKASPGSGGTTQAKAGTASTSASGSAKSDMLNQPQSVVWQEALKSLGMGATK
jgi:uncharacterized protein (DUF697 family)